MVKSASAPPITQPPILRHTLVQVAPGGFQGNESAGDQRGVDPDQSIAI
jgi:hypothetical protein